MKQMIFALLLAFMLVIPFAHASKLELDHQEIFFDHACSYYKMYYDGADISKDITTLEVNKKTEVIGEISNGRFQVLNSTKYISPDVAVKDAALINEIKSVVEKSEYRMVRYCADIKRVQTKEGWKISADHIPEFVGTEYAQYDWWNNSYTYRLPITMTTASYNLKNVSSGNFTITHNGHTTNCGEFVATDKDNKVIRMNVSSCSATTAVVSIQGNADSDGEISYIYYGNTSPVANQISNELLVRSVGSNDYSWEEQATTDGWESHSLAGGGGQAILNQVAKLDINSDSTRKMTIVSGTPSGELEATFARFSTQQPKSIEFWARFDSTTKPKYNEYLRFMNSTNNTLIEFNTNDGTAWYLNNSGVYVNTTIPKDTAGNITIDKINFTSCTYNVFSNGVSIVTGATFWSCASNQNITGIKVYTSYDNDGVHQTNIQLDDFKVKHDVTVTVGSESQSPLFTLNTFYEKNSTAIECYDVTFSNSTYSLSKLVCQNNTFSRNETEKSGFPIGLVKVAVSKTGFGTRNYYVSNFYADTGATITAYLLEDGSHSTVRWHTLSVSGSSISGIKVDISKLIGSSWVTVETEYSDSAGTATTLLDSAGSYMVYATGMGYLPYTSPSPITPSLSDYNIPMVASSSAYVNTLFGEITWEVFPQNLYLPNNINQGFWLNVQNLNTTLNNYGFNLTYWNGTQLCSPSGNFPRGSNVSCYYNLNGLNDTLIMRIYINNTAYSFWYQDITFNLNNMTTSNSTLDHVLSNFDDYGLGTEAKWFIMLVTIIIISATCSMGFGLGLEGGGIGAILTIFGFAVYGWLPILFAIAMGILMVLIIVRRFQQ